MLMAWVFHAFVPLVLCLLGVKTVWALSFRCFVSSLTAWAKFLCLRVLLFSLSVELLQILIFWLPYLGFVLPHLSETTFTTLWDSLPCSCCSPLSQVFTCMFYSPHCSILVAALSRIPRLFLQVKTPTLLGYRKLKTVCDFHTSLTSIKFKNKPPSIQKWAGLYFFRPQLPSAIFKQNICPFCTKWWEIEHWTWEVTAVPSNRKLGVWLLTWHSVTSQGLGVMLGEENWDCLEVFYLRHSFWLCCF